MNKPRDIDYILDEVVTLPSLPTTVSRITQLVSDPQCSLASVAKAISSDPAIALKTLRLVNSAYYGLGTKVSTVEHAVVLLGLKVIKNLVFTAAVFDTLKGGIDSLLRHSIACGVAMRVLSDAAPVKGLDSSEEAFIFGLLHDVGMIIFDQFMPKEYALVSTACQGRKIPRFQAEREIIGVDHAMIGARLAQKWKLPDSIVNVVGGHHDLAQCADPQLRPVAAMLGAADYLCSACTLSSYTNATVQMSADLWAASGLRGEQIPDIMDRFFTAFPDIEELLQLAM